MRCQDVLPLPRPSKLFLEKLHIKRTHCYGSLRGSGSSNCCTMQEEEWFVTPLQKSMQLWTKDPWNRAIQAALSAQQMCHYGVLWIHPHQWSVEEQTELSSWKRMMQVLWVNLALWMPLSVILYIFIKRYAGRVSAAHPLFKTTKVRLLSNIQHLVPFSARRHHPC